MRGGAAGSERVIRRCRGLSRWGAAVALMAAAPWAAGCGGRTDPRAGSVAGEEGRPVRSGDVPVMPTRWLIPPGASLDPPLAAPTAIAVDGERGRLYVLELQPPELRVYDLSDGRFLRSLGRQGDGPGEYRYPTALAVSADGVVAVLSMSGRVTYWDPDGSLRGIVHAGSGIASDIVAAGRDTFYVKSDVFPPDDVSEFWVVTTDTSLPEPRYRDSGVSETEEPGQRFRNHAYAVAATLEGDLLLSPPGPDYFILRIGRRGTVRQTIRRREVPPLRRSEQEIAEVRERVRKGFAAAGRAAPSEFRVPLYRSHVGRLATAPDGSIWALTQRGDDRASVVDCFAADGRYSASYRIELQVIDLAVASDAVYFLVVSSMLDVPAIAVASLEDTLEWVDVR